MTLRFQAALLCALLGSPGVALADATVNVRVVDAAGRPADGKVTLRGPKTLACDTVASRCSVKGPAGKYTATVVPRRDKAPAAKAVKVPSAGTAQVVITLLPADPAPKQASAKSADSEHDKVRKNPPGKNLAQGKRKAATGRVVDAAGRPVDALIVIKPAGKKTVSGHVVSVAARFSVHDLPAGKYEAQVYSRRGGAPTTQTIQVTSQPGQIVIKVK